MQFKSQDTIFWNCVEIFIKECRLQRMLEDIFKNNIYDIDYKNLLFLSFVGLGSRKYS